VRALGVPESNDRPSWEFGREFATAGYVLTRPVRWLSDDRNPANTVCGLISASCNAAKMFGVDTIVQRVDSPGSRDSVEPTRSKNYKSRISV
jgi:hypothetical protein